MDVMRLNKLVCFMTLSLIFFNLINPIIIAKNDEAESFVDAWINISFLTATDMNIDVTMDVDEIVVFDTKYTSSEISTLSDMEIMGAIKLTLRNLLKKQLEGSFQNAIVLAKKDKPSYESNMFYDEFTINITSQFFNLNETVNTYDFINGLLDVGAQIEYTLHFKAENGWNNHYYLDLPNNLKRTYTTGLIEGDKILYKVENENGFHPESVEKLRIAHTNPTTSNFAREDININFGFDCRKSQGTNLTISVNIKNIDIRNFNILPDFVTKLDTLPSDGIRLLIENGFFSFEELYNATVQPITVNIIGLLKNSSFNQSLDMNFDWNSKTTTDCPEPFNVQSMDNTTPIIALFYDSQVTLNIFNISSRALFGLVNSGAHANISSIDINFGDNLENLGYPHNITFYLPEGVSINNKKEYTWKSNALTLGDIKSNIAPKYSKEEIDTIIDVEIVSTDLNLIRFFTGTTELTLGLFIDEKQNYKVASLPSELRLHDKISLNYINSDAFRLCYEENVLSENNLNDMIDNKKNHFDQTIKKIFANIELDVKNDKDAFLKSLKWDGNISRMDEEIPVKFISYSYSSYPALFSLSLIPPKFDIQERSYTFTGIENQNVTYRMLFPSGLKIQVRDELEKTIIQQTDDGKTLLTLSFGPNEYDKTDVVTINITPSAIFIIGIFMPCILSLIITLILLVIIYILRKKRKGKKGFVKQESQDYSDLENQDYYVPPPPPSVRR